MSGPDHNLAILESAINPKKGAIKVLIQIDRHFDDVDELIKALPIKNKDELCSRLYALYDELETSVGEVYATL